MPTSLSPSFNPPPCPPPLPPPSPPFKGGEGGVGGKREKGGGGGGSWRPPGVDLKSVESWVTSMSGRLFSVVPSGL